jgi:hypothetical protein
MIKFEQGYNLPDGGTGGKGRKLGEARLKEHYGLSG